MKKIEVIGIDYRKVPSVDYRKVQTIVILRRCGAVHIKSGLKRDTHLFQTHPETKLMLEN